MSRILGVCVDGGPLEGEKRSVGSEQTEIASGEFVPDPDAKDKDGAPVEGATKPWGRYVKDASSERPFRDGIDAEAGDFDHDLAAVFEFKYEKGE